MEPGVIIAIAGLISAAAASFATFIVAARRMSGKIKTSDATDLWAVAKDMRAELTSRLGISEARQTALEARMAVLERENISLIRENANLNLKITTQETLIEALNYKIDAQTAIIEELRTTIKSLESGRP
jgi:predicted  nucleic acid-binding Zn-ribbon protein